MERIEGILTRLNRIEEDQRSLDRLWRSTVDDIKATIRSEISDLKGEQIADLKKAIADRDEKLERFENRLRDAEDKLMEWNTGRGLFNWFIRTAIALGALGAGYLGGKHIGN